jgi:GGDEF domain-containing protein
MQTLPFEPTVSEFEYFLSQAMACQGKLITFAWKSAASSNQFMVKLTHQPGYRTLWQLHRYEYGKAVVIMEHTSNDVLLIHNLIMCASGSSDKAVNAEAALSVNGPQRDVSKVSYVSSRGTALSNTDGQVVKTTSELPKVEIKAAVAETFQSKSSNGFASESFKVEDPGEETRRVMAALFGQTQLGILSYSAYLFLLQRELDKARATQTPVSIVVLQALIYAETPTQTHRPLPMQASVEMVDRINKAKREIDSLAQLDHDRLILLMPGITKEAAKEFAARLERYILESPLCVGIEPANLNVSSGVATFPGEGQDLDTLVAKACGAQCKAKVATAKAINYPKPTKPTIAKILQVATWPAAS